MSGSSKLRNVFSFMLGTLVLLAIACGSLAFMWVLNQYLAPHLPSFGAKVIHWLYIASIVLPVLILIAIVVGGVKQVLKKIAGLQ